METNADTGTLSGRLEKSRDRIASLVRDPRNVSHRKIIITIALISAVSASQWCK